MPGNKSKARERERKEEEAGRDYRARDFLAGHLSRFYSDVD